jgi:hypothetical protein
VELIGNVVEAQEVVIVLRELDVVVHVDALRPAADLPRVAEAHQPGQREALDTAQAAAAFRLAALGAAAMRLAAVGLATTCGFV